MGILPAVPVIRVLIALAALGVGHYPFCGWEFPTLTHTKRGARSCLFRVQCKVICPERGWSGTLNSCSHSSSCLLKLKETTCRTGFASISFSRCAFASAAATCYNYALLLCSVVLSGLLVTAPLLREALHAGTLCCPVHAETAQPRGHWGSLWCQWWR